MRKMRELEKRPPNNFGDRNSVFYFADNLLLLINIIS